MREKLFMVITTHMYNQMIRDNQKESNNEKIPNNPDSSLIKSFLKDSTESAITEKKVIFSNS